MSGDALREGPRTVSPGKRGDYLCEGCDILVDTPATSVATYPKGDQFIVCPSHAAKAVAAGAAIRPIHD